MWNLVIGCVILFVFFPDIFQDYTILCVISILFSVWRIISLVMQERVSEETTDIIIEAIDRLL